jgi:hypothetical protein
LITSRKPSDPLGSSYPLPWDWVLKTQAEVSAAIDSDVRLHRTPELMSPDGEYIAYSQVTLQVSPQLRHCRASSQVYVEELDTGELYPVSPGSPMAVCGVSAIDAMQMRGTIAIGIPVSWSKTGDRLLVRQFEGIFCTSEATDYAVVWERRNRRTLTLAPTRLHYTHAILSGWSEHHSDRVLFQVCVMGERSPGLYGVNLSGVTLSADGDRPRIYE